MKYLFLVLFLILGFNSLSFAKENLKACLTKCVTPYGTLLGQTTDGVEAYSNCRPDCVIFEPNHFKKVYTGIKWQCVEYARRWLLKNFNVVYGDVDYAYDIWDKIHELNSPKGFPAKKLALDNIKNGNISNFQKGDLLIYAKDHENTGHVAIILEHNKSENWITVAEENFLNTKWPGSYARKIALSDVLCYFT